MMKLINSLTIFMFDVLEGNKKANENTEFLLIKN